LMILKNQLIIGTIVVRKMINNISDLVAVFKVWWHTPIKLERKPKLPEPSEYQKILDSAPPHTLDLMSVSSEVFTDEYFKKLFDRKANGEPLSWEERHRLESYFHINDINYGLEHPDDFWEDR
jgi:hypothetical protein